MRASDVALGCALSLASLFSACSSASRLGVYDSLPSPDHASDGAVGDASSDVASFDDVPLDARLARAETAWLASHLADPADRANPRENDAVRRLSQLGGEGVVTVAEVFRVRDARRLPFARRVVERVALRRCLYDHERAAWVISRIERGANPAALGDAGIAWQMSDDAWTGEAVERLRAWGRDGAPCDAPSRSDGGASADASRAD